MTWLIWPCEQLSLFLTWLCLQYAWLCIVELCFSPPGPLYASFSHVKYFGLDEVYKEELTLHFKVCLCYCTGMLTSYPLGSNLWDESQYLKRFFCRVEEYLVVSPPMSLTSPSYAACSLFQIPPLQQVRKGFVSPFCDNSCLAICLVGTDDTACSLISSWLVSELLVHPCMLLSHLWSLLCHSSIHEG